MPKHKKEQDERRKRTPKPEGDCPSCERSGHLRYIYAMTSGTPSSGIAACPCILGDWWRGCMFDIGTTVQNYDKLPARLRMEPLGSFHELRAFNRKIHDTLMQAKSQRRLPL